MKKQTLLIAVFAIAGALLLNSCKKDNPDPNGGGSGGSGGGGTVIEEELDFSYREEADMPANAPLIFGFVPVGQYVEPDSGSFATNTDAELANEGFTQQQVLKINGKSLQIRIMNNPTQNFDFMDSIKIHVAKKDGSNKTLFAYKYNYPLGLRTLDMDMTATDVKDIFQSDSAKIYFGGTKRGTAYSIQGNTKIEFNTIVTATVNVVK